MPQTQNTARIDGRRSSRGCFGGDQDTSATTPLAQAPDLTAAERLSRFYQQQSRELPGALGRQAVALASFYGARAREVAR